MNILKPTELEDSITDALTVVMVSAPWCGPCRAMKPYFEHLIEKYPNVPTAYVSVTDHWGTMDIALDGTPLYKSVYKFPSMFLLRNKEIVEDIDFNQVTKVFMDYDTLK